MRIFNLYVEIKNRLCTKKLLVKHSLNSAVVLFFCRVINENFHLYCEITSFIIIIIINIITNNISTARDLRTRCEKGDFGNLNKMSQNCK